MKIGQKADAFALRDSSPVRNTGRNAMKDAVGVAHACIGPFVPGRQARSARNPDQTSRRHTMLETDRKLLDGFRRGDRSALERVYKAYADELIAFFRRGFGFQSGGQYLRFRGSTSTFQVEDWVHEVFVKAFSESGRSQYDGLRPYGPYLKMIARNLVLDELRRKEHRLRAQVEEVPEPGKTTDFEVSTPESPEEAARRQQLLRHVEEFVESLPQRERAVYTSRFREGLEQKDVAQKIGISVSKVKTSEKRIREQFHSYLAEKGWVESHTRKGLRS